MFYNEISGEIEYRKAEDESQINLTMLSNDSIKAIFGDEFFDCQ